MGATPAAGPTLGTRHPTPIRHIFTVTPRIAEELASTFTFDLHITAIGTADPDISIIGITAGIVIGRSRIDEVGRSAGVSMLIRDLLKKGLKIEKLASRRKAS